MKAKFPQMIGMVGLKMLHTHITISQSQETLIGWKAAGTPKILLNNPTMFSQVTCTVSAGTRHPFSLWQVNPENTDYTKYIRPGRLVGRVYMIINDPCSQNNLLNTVHVLCHPQPWRCAPAHFILLSRPQHRHRKSNTVSQRLLRIFEILMLNLLQGDATIWSHLFTIYTKLVKHRLCPSFYVYKTYCE